MTPRTTTFVRLITIADFFVGFKARRAGDGMQSLGWRVVETMGGGEVRMLFKRSRYVYVQIVVSHSMVY